MRLWYQFPTTGLWTGGLESGLPSGLWTRLWNGILTPNNASMYRAVSVEWIPAHILQTARVHWWEPVLFQFKRNHQFFRISLSIPWTLTRLQTSLSKSNYPLQLIWLITQTMHVLQTVCFYQKNIRVNNRHDSCFYTKFTKLDYTQIRVNFYLFISFSVVVFRPDETVHSL